MRFPIDDLIAEVRREVRMRRNVYPRFVGDGRWTQQEADERIDKMVAVEELLLEVRAKAQPTLFDKPAT